MANLKQGIDNLVKEVTTEPKPSGYDVSDSVTIDSSDILGKGKELESQGYTRSWVGEGKANYAKKKPIYNTNPETGEIIEPEMTYPKGTSKEYTDKVNAAYDKAMELLKSKGIDMSGYKSWDSEHGGMEDNMKEEFFDKYVFGPFREKYGKLPAFDSNKKWESEGYRELYDAFDSFYDKQYNDWWINKHKNQSDAQNTVQKNSSFDGEEFETQIPRNMRYKKHKIMPDGTLYWVTQQEFSPNDLEYFKQAMKSYGINKAYVILRDNSVYDFETDAAKGKGTFIDLTQGEL